MKLLLEAEGSATEVLKHRRRLSPRQNSGGGGQTASVIIGIVVLLVISLAVVLYVIVKSKRRSSSQPEYLPGDGLAQRLRRWAGRRSSRGEYSTQLQPSESRPSLIRVGRGDGGASRERSREPSQDRSREVDNDDPERQMDNDGTGNTTSGAGIDRSTSIRSIMTLPAYSESARDSEQILGREGERAGMDVVIEYPEDQDEEEDRREEEMESLYQIRRQRRQEAAEREERRRLRREARARGDYETLNRLQVESRRRQDETLASQILIAEHQSRNRERRVSSVQYADLGVARHDGSRIRANSTDSDNRPLLDNAASIAGSSIRPTSLAHHRGRSASSVLSISTTASDEIFGAAQPSPAHRTMSRDSRADSDFEFVSLHNGRSRSPSLAPSNQHPQEADLGEQHIPTDMPPEYEGIGWGPHVEEAPPYESPVSTRAPQLPSPANTRAPQISSPASMRAPQLPALNTLTGELPAIEISVASPMSRTGSSVGRSRSPSPHR